MRAEPRPLNTDRTSGRALARSRRPTAAFTLIEMLLALAVSAIVLAGVGGVFFSGMRLRERTLALLDQTAPLQQTMGYLRRDLQGALPPDVMAGDFKIGSINSAIGQSVGLQFTTTTGIIGDDAPWSELQQVTYELRDPVSPTNGAGRELFRTVTHNLLATGLPDYNEQFLLGNIESIDWQGFDGTDWRDLWDTSLSDTNLPMAVRIRLHLVPEPGVDPREQQPFELVVPVLTQSRTNEVQQVSATQ